MTRSRRRAGRRRSGPSGEKKAKSCATARRPPSGPSRAGGVVSASITTAPWPARTMWSTSSAPSVVVLPAPVAPGIRTWLPDPAVPRLMKASLPRRSRPIGIRPPSRCLPRRPCSRCRRSNGSSRPRLSFACECSRSPQRLAGLPSRPAVPRARIRSRAIRQKRVSKAERRRTPLSRRLAATAALAANRRQERGGSPHPHPSPRRRSAAAAPGPRGRYAAAERRPRPGQSRCSACLRPDAVEERAPCLVRLDPEDSFHADGSAAPGEKRPTQPPHLPEAPVVEAARAFQGPGLLPPGVSRGHPRKVHRSRSRRGRPRRGGPAPTGCCGPSRRALDPPRRHRAEAPGLRETCTAT